MKHRIVIVGFMGCGKTTVARALAERLGCEMIDLDSLITEREARSPADIIRQDGEQAFRRIETRHLRDALKQRNACVISLGGGTWTIEENRKLIKRGECFTVWLDVPFETCWQRITAGQNTIRPLAPDQEAAQKLHRSRMAAYAQADLRVASNNKRVESIVDEILIQS